MKTLQQLREKHWSNPAPLYPALTSPSKLKVRFDFKDFGIDMQELKYANWNFFVAQCCSAICCDDYAAAEANNRANYHLAGAYQIEGKNVEFWGQFS